MANPGSALSAATNDFAASEYSNRCSNNRPRMKALCAAAEWVEVGKVALPKPGIACACVNPADKANNRTSRNVFFIGTLAFEQRRFIVAHPHRPRPPATACGCTTRDVLCSKASVPMKKTFLL